MSVYNRDPETGKTGAVVHSRVDDDDWETDPDFVNDVDEKEQRWGMKQADKAEVKEVVDIKAIRQAALEQDIQASQADYQANPKHYGQQGR